MIYEGACYRDWAEACSFVILKICVIKVAIVWNLP